VTSLDSGGTMGATLDSGRIVMYPGVLPSHVAGAMILDRPPSAANASPPGMYPADIRSVVGVSVAAALEKGVPLRDGWMIGIV
jgi:hypothetical protein